MENNFGIARVLEPYGVIPVTAWKVDNSLELKSGEMLVELEKIHLDWESFSHICNSCNFDEVKIKNKIFDIVEKRGKMHNPFTSTGGTLVGTIKKISSRFDSKWKSKEGDKIYCLASLCGIPLRIEEIYSIDYNFAQVTCKGYAILFESSPIFNVDKEIDTKYALTAINETGCIYTTYKLALENEVEKVGIIGRNACITLLYSQAIKMANSNCKIVGIIDKDAQNDNNFKEVMRLVNPLVDIFQFVDFGSPYISYEEMKKNYDYIRNLDAVIIADDMYGAETIAVLATKDKGYMYFTTAKNHYDIAQNVAETLGKDINIMSFDQYIEEYPSFTHKVILEAKKSLERLEELYSKSDSSVVKTVSRIKNLISYTAGKNDDFFYKSKVTKKLVDEVVNIAKYDCNVIIQGETGVGKERILSLIHQNSSRRSNHCIKINCATIQESLAESEFFGYEAGAFTGANNQSKIGYFEMANNGILFLDEIGSLSLNMQSKLLRVIQDNTFFRVGGTKQISVNVRVVVANNVPLKDLVEKGLFREDLYYRLNICQINVPPLRSRIEDIGCLAKLFCERLSKKYGIEKTISDEAVEVLEKYNWPGNVRELENFIHKLIISSEDIVIEPKDVGDIFVEKSSSEDISFSEKNSLEEINFIKVMEENEKALIEYALKEKGTVRKAAAFLGLPQTTFARKKIKFGL